MQREIDKKYRLFISGLNCLVCNAPGLNDPHHWQKKGHGGMGTKCSDRRCVPLCFHHHREIHQHGVRTFMEKYNISYDLLEAVIELYNRKYEEFYAHKKV